MPELPEVETTLRGIVPHIDGYYLLIQLTNIPVAYWALYFLPKYERNAYIKFRVAYHHLMILL